ncbi:MAG: ATP synthase F1 subunit delta [Deltaproteobacteria bacterium]|nr:ATP synthase F1 subunit delta [Deltaproteobacteria bacterium]
MKTSVARRYARALIEIASETGEVGAYGKEVRTVYAAFESAPELYKTLMNPMFPVEDRLGLTEKVSASLKLSKPVERFLGILVKTRGLRLLADIAEAYSRLEDDISGKIRVTVLSPVDMDAAALDEIKKKISAATGKEAAVSCSKDASLIGGMVVKVGNTILDGSLKTQIERMKEKILEGAI